MTKNHCSENKRLQQKKHAYTDYLRVLLHLCAPFGKMRKDYLLLHKHFNKCGRIFELIIRYPQGKSADYVNKCVQYMPPRPVKNSDPQWIWDYQ